jgi:hypothetical protein
MPVIKTCCYFLILISVFFVAGCSSNKKVTADKNEFDNSLPPKKKVWAFILAGQSNMAGRGAIEPEDTITSKNIFTINANGEIVPAKEPLHFYEPSRIGLDCGLSFAKTLKSQIEDDVAILLVPTAVGGSSISQWIDDSTHRDVKLLSNFTEKIRTAQRVATIKGILWHQGESDANDNDIPRYRERLITLFKKFRTIAGVSDLPILIGELGSYSVNPAEWKQINEQIELYATTDSHVKVIRTNDFHHKGDQIHFDSKGQRTMGQRFAQSYLEMPH